MTKLLLQLALVVVLALGFVFVVNNFTTWDVWTKLNVSLAALPTGIALLALWRQRGQI
jgi:hypothetical protein